MASVKYSGIAITEMVGKIGGTVAQRNAGGAFVKKSTAHSRGRTAAQTAQMASSSFLASQWRVLTAPQRLAWRRAAQSGEWPRVNRLGEVGKLTGFQLWMELNGNLQAINTAPIILPPVKLAMADVAIETTSISIGGQSLSLGLSANPGSAVVSLWSSPPIGSGIESPALQLLFDKGWAGVGDVTYTNWVLVFGEPIAGARYLLEVYMTEPTTGQKRSIGKVFGDISA